MKRVSLLDHNANTLNCWRSNKTWWANYPKTRYKTRWDVCHLNCHNDKIKQKLKRR